jgi:DedD protein
MISLPSFLKNSKSDISDSGSNSSEPEDEYAENPEKQKARHRLLGSIFLVLIAIIGLPKLFDSQPKKVNNDVILQVVTSVTDEKKQDSIQDPPPLSFPDKQVDAKLVESPKSTKSSEQSLNVGEEVVDDANNLKKNSDGKSSPDKLAAKPSNLESEKPKDTSPTDKSIKAKYVVQVGTFSTSEAAKKMQARLKNENISSSITEKKKDENNTLYTVRVGPLSSKSEAEGLVQKISSIGISPRLIQLKN